MADGPVAVASGIPNSYSVVYRDESHAGGEITVSTAKVWVRRPFESRTEAWSGPPPGTRRLSSTVNALTRLQVDRGVFAVPPGPPAEERRADVFVREATARGYAQARERRRVIGRVCRVYRIGGDPGIDSLKPLSRVDDEYSEVCIDRAGIVLEEVSVADGKMLLRRLATRVEEQPTMSDSLFEVDDPTIPADQGGGSARRVDPRSRPPGAFWDLPSAPRGFRHLGRWAVVPPQAGFDDPLRRRSIVAWVSDVYTRGLDVVVIEQGATLQGAEPFESDANAQKVDAGALGRGELLYALRASELQVKLQAGRFVRLVGTVPPSELVATARQLRSVSGNRLRYLDGAGR